MAVDPRCCSLAVVPSPPSQISNQYKKGAFVGVSLEGSIVATRMDASRRFYGDPAVTTTEILLGALERPPAANSLYSALNDLYSIL